MSSPSGVNNRPTVAPTRTAAAATDTGDAAGQGVQSAKDLLAGGSYKIGVNGSSSKEEVAPALVKLAGDQGVWYTQMAEGLGKTFKDRMLKGVESQMNTWLQANKNATPDQVAAQAKKILGTQLITQQSFKSTIDSMASAAIDRMKDAFEG